MCTSSVRNVLYRCTMKGWDIDSRILLSSFSFSMLLKCERER